MKHIWDAIAAIVITAIVLHLLVQLIKPYVPYLLIAAVLAGVGALVYRRWQRYNSW